MAATQGARVRKEKKTLQNVREEDERRKEEAMRRLMEARERVQDDNAHRREAKQKADAEYRKTMVIRAERKRQELKTKRIHHVLIALGAIATSMGLLWLFQYVDKL